MAPTPPAPAIRSDVKAFLDLLAAQAAVSFADIGAPAARAGMAMMGQMFDVETGPLARIADMVVTGGDNHAIPLRLYDSRRDRGPSTVVMFFHGGGFVMGDLNGYAQAAPRLPARWNCRLYRSIISWHLNISGLPPLMIVKRHAAGWPARPNSVFLSPA